MSGHFYETIVNILTENAGMSRQKDEFFFLVNRFINSVFSRFLYTIYTGWHLSPGFVPYTVNFK